MTNKKGIATPKAQVGSLSPPSMPSGLETISAIFAGKMDLAHVPINPAASGTKNDLCAVFFRDWERVHHAFVIDALNKRNVYPCVKLSRLRGQWRAEPFLFESSKRDLVRLQFSEQWLRILFDLTT